MQAKQGHSVLYLSEGGDYEPLLSKVGVRTLKFRQKSRNPYDIFDATRKLVKIIRDYRPDLVHAHMMAAAAIGFAATRITNTPLITTVHNSFDWHSQVMRLGDRVVAVSHAERASLLKRGFPNNKIRVVLNGPNRSPRSEWMLTQSSGPVERDGPRIVTVCGLHRRKGVFDLINAFHTAVINQPDWKLYIAGDGPDRLMLEGLCGKLGIGHRVRFLGNLPYPQQLLQSSEVFVLASYADPCSLAVAEARYAGCACIATAVGGTPELLGDGRHGILVEPGNIVQISSALARLMGSPDELAMWRERALLESEYLTAERVCNDYEEVYREAAGIALASTSAV